MLVGLLFFFFFQAEDGIRDIGVTGVQTCALPIYLPARAPKAATCVALGIFREREADAPTRTPADRQKMLNDARKVYRSEERRVGKECRSRWSPYNQKKKRS